MKRIYHDKFTGLKEREQLRIALDHCKSATHNHVISHVINIIY